MKHSRENFSVRLSKEERAGLDEIQEHLGIVPAKLVRDAVAAVVDAYRRERFLTLPLEFKFKLPAGELKRRVEQDALRALPAEARGRRGAKAP